jgi:enoyl-CoA hydratase/carnithine racemase
VRYQFIRVERDGPLTIISFNRPEVLNALHAPAHWELHEAFDDFAADPAQWVAIVTGGDCRAFSAGNDLKHHAGGGRMDKPPTGWGGLSLRFDLAKPVIAAVNGPAMGGAFEMALACDLIIAADNAFFALPEPKLGLCAVAGGLVRLPQAIGVKRAMGIILTGRRVSAHEGCDLGFVTAVAPVGQVMTEARRWAGMIADGSPRSVQAAKQVVYRALDEPTLASAMVNQNLYPAVTRLFASKDPMEGPRAFVEKRAPIWISNLPD